MGFVAFRPNDAHEPNLGRPHCRGYVSYPRSAAHRRSHLTVKSRLSTEHEEDKRFRVIALTNNYGSAGADADEAELAHLGWQDGAVPDALHALFDDFCDSSTLGMRLVGRLISRFYLPKLPRH